MTFYDNGSATGWHCGTTGTTTTVKLTNGNASCLYVAPSAGTHVITVTYSGDDLHAPVTTAGPALTELVSIAVVPTVTVASSSNPVAYNAPTTFTATVSGTSGTPTGAVSFTVNGLTVGCSSVPLVAGVATCSWTAPAMGSGISVPVVAQYSGDNVYAAKNSAAVTQVELGPGAAGFTLNSSKPAGAAAGTRVTFTATSTATPPPTGKVTFVDTTTGLTMCTASINASGVATCGYTLTAPSGSQTITATYSGDANYAVETDTYSQTVT
jgi:hypothetical protein